MCKTRFILFIGIGSLVALFVLVTDHEPEPRTESLFVYGTLMNPIARVYACHCFTTLKPAVLPGYEKQGRNIIPADDSSVPGGIIFVSRSELEQIDRYEGTPNTYRREQIEIGNEQHWVYIKNEKN